MLYDFFEGCLLRNNTFQVENIYSGAISGGDFDITG